MNVETICSTLCSGMERGKASSVVVVAEGGESGGVYEIAKRMKTIDGPECKIVVLGHLQRGGNPSARDRILASRLGAAAVDALVAGKSDVMVGELNGEIAFCRLEETFENRHPIDHRTIELAKVLAI
jgi:6-phosphofructokinase 1